MSTRPRCAASCEAEPHTTLLTNRRCLLVGKPTVPVLCCGVVCCAGKVSLAMYAKADGIEAYVYEDKIEDADAGGGLRTARAGCLIAMHSWLPLSSVLEGALEHTERYHSCALQCTELMHHCMLTQ